MKVLAQEVKEGMEVQFGWNEWLKVESIEIDHQKNGKELRIFNGSSKQEVRRKRGGRKLRQRPPIEKDSCTYKSLTTVIVR